MENYIFQVLFTNFCKLMENKWELFWRIRITMRILTVYFDEMTRNVTQFAKRFCIKKTVLRQMYQNSQKYFRNKKSKQRQTLLRRGADKRT